MCIIWNHCLEGKAVNCAETAQRGETHRSVSSQPPLLRSQRQVCRLIRLNVRQLLSDPAGVNHVSLGGLIRGSFPPPAFSLLWCCCGSGSFGPIRLGPVCLCLVVLQDQNLEIPQFQRVHSACPPAVLSSSQTCCLTSSVFFINWSQT